MRQLDPQGLVLAICMAFFLIGFFLYHLMVFRVNRNLPFSERIPHSLNLTKKDRVIAEYKALYPRSILYQLVLVCAVTMLLLAIVFLVLRFLSLTR